jgi:hypothetical protein
MTITIFVTVTVITLYLEYITTKVCFSVTPAPSLSFHLRLKSACVTLYWMKKISTYKNCNKLVLKISVNLSEM